MMLRNCWLNFIKEDRRGVWEEWAYRDKIRDDEHLPERLKNHNRTVFITRLLLTRLNSGV